MFSAIKDRNLSFISSVTQHLVAVRQSSEGFHEALKALKRMVELTVGVSHLVFSQTASQISCNNMNCECRYCSTFFLCQGYLSKLGLWGLERRGPFCMVSYLCKNVFA